MRVVFLFLLRFVVQPLAGLVFSRAILEVCHLQGIYPENILASAMSWGLGALANDVAFWTILTMLTAALWAVADYFLYRRYMPTVSGSMRGKKGGDGLMPLAEAAKEAYEKTLGSEYARAAEEFARDTDDPETELMNYYAQYFFGEDDPPIYGYETPSKELRRLPHGAGRRGNPIEGGASYCSYEDKKPRYTGLKVGREYLSRVIRELKADAESNKSPRKPDLITFYEFVSMAIAAGWPADRDEVRWIEFFRLLREAARNDWVQLWGRKERFKWPASITSEPREPISSEHWNEFQIDPNSVLSAVESTDSRSYNLKRNDWGGSDRYRDLHIERKAAKNWLAQNKCK